MFLCCPQQIKLIPLTLINNCSLLWQADKTTCIHFSTWHSNLINSQISQDLNLKNVLFFLFCVSCWSPVIHGFKTYTSDVFVTLPELWDLSRRPLLKTLKTQHSLHQFSDRRLHPYIETYRLACCWNSTVKCVLMLSYYTTVFVVSLGFDHLMCSHFGRLCTCTFAYCCKITWTLCAPIGNMFCDVALIW